MLPRKRQRHNPSDSSSSQSQETLGSSAHANSASEQAPAPTPATHLDRHTPNNSPATATNKLHNSVRHNQKQVRKSQSWYGSWPRPPKASASTSVARENIFGDNIKSQSGSDLARFDSKASDESSSIRSKADSTIHPIQHPDSSIVAPRLENESTIIGEQNGNGHSDHKPISNASETNVVNQPVSTSDAAPETPDRPPPSSTWLGWFTQTPFTDTPFTTPNRNLDSESVAAIPESTPTANESEQVDATVPPEQAPPNTLPAQSSWFGLWSTPTQSAATMKDDEKSDVPKGEQKASNDTDTPMEDAPVEQPEQPPKAGSTWAFWSRDTGKNETKTVQTEEGQIAVIGQGSENHPLPMTENGVSGDADAATVEVNKNKSTKSTWRKNKRARPASIDDSSSPSRSGVSTPNPDKEAVAAPPSTDRSVSDTKTHINEGDSTSKFPPNLLLPSFTNTYQMKENKSILQQISQFLLRTAQPPANHVFRVQSPPKIRKAISIGVHGLLPATYLRPMIGQPTGTSIRFANLGAEAIRRWTDSHGCTNCEIEKVALEGEGRINERVENLWKLLLNWIDQIRKADLVILACHSQGVPVGIMLLERLIELGVITDARIGVCAMAGVALGPFPEYKSSLLMGSAAELWDFGNPQSQNAQKFETSLKRVLDYGARITFIGSIDDQVVPMESAVYSPASHPYIFRAVFIDGRVHAPDFIAHLVGFALKLRNLGISDHGLVRELSLALAGSLYSGEGHSRIYFDSAVYDLAVSHALETTSVSSPTECQIQHRPQIAPVSGTPAPLSSTNPYVLPWIMRGLLEEDFVKTELSSETEELLRQYDDWKPTSKALKDVKYRLEVVRSKL